MQTNLHRNAKIELEVINSNRGHPQVHIAINGTDEHLFGTSSRISKALDHMTPEQIRDRMSGGDFFVADGQLVDFRYGDYNGFVHTDQSIDALKQHIGIEHTSGRRFGGGAGNTISKNIRLGSIASSRDIQVPTFGDGGKFNSELSFIWSPFVKNVTSTFNILRLICANGMVGRTSLFNTSIPLVNRWMEHLAIAERQIQNKVEHRVVDRITSLNDNRASVQMLSQLYAHAMKRFDGADSSESDRERLRTIMSAVSPRIHLSGVYPNHLLSDTNVTAQLPGHLSQFDAYNVATEIRSHTTQTSTSTDNALDKFGSDLLFSDDLPHFARKNSLINSGCSFSSPDKAFHGAL